MRKKWSKLIVFALVIIMTFAMSNSIALAGDFPANPTTKTGYTLDFSDEFNGTSLDSTKWIDYYFPCWADDLSKAKAQYKFENGCLVEYITADQEAWCPDHDGTVKSSAIMSFDKSWIHNFSGTNDNQARTTWYGYATTYGYFEVRAKFADCGGGGHQAWWLVGMQQDTDDWFNSQQTGEIDIIESFFSMPTVWQICAYGWNDPNFQTSWFASKEPVPSGSPTTEFHIYAMDWTPNSLKFYYDNQLYKEIYDAPDYDMGMILNIYTDAGSGVHNDVWPKEWAVDYVRVWKDDAGYAPKIYHIQNAETGKYMYIDPLSTEVKYGDITSENEEHAKWYKESIGSYVLFINVATDEYMHIENLTGKVEHGIVPSTYWSAQWTEDAYGSNFRFGNRWQSGNYIYTMSSDNPIQYGYLSGNEQESKWQLIDQNGFYNIKNVETGKYMYIDPSNTYVQFGDITSANEELAKWNKEVDGNYVRFKNVSTNEYIHIENLTGKIEHGSVLPTYWSAQWTEEADGSYFRYQNRWKAGIYFFMEENENEVVYGPVDQNTPTSIWQVSEVNG